MIASSTSPRPAGLAVGFALDVLLGDPRRYHPVAGFGALAARAERSTYADRRRAGAAHLALLAGGATGLAWLTGRRLRGRPGLELAATAAATWAVLGGTSLARAAHAVEAALAADDLALARRRIGGLVSRDSAAMDAAAVTRACVESVAENTSDAVIGPLLWGAAAGLPGLVMYRSVNTLDAMIGYHNERYERFGWAAARADDLLNLVPSRLTAALVGVLAPLVGGSTPRVWRVVVRDAPAHPSPNGGVVESAFAAALGVRLGGVNEYDGRAQDRGTLGDGPAPGAGDIGRAVTLSRAVSVGAVAVAGAAAAARRGRAGRSYHGWPSRSSRARPRSASSRSAWC